MPETRAEDLQIIKENTVDLLGVKLLPAAAGAAKALCQNSGHSNARRLLRCL